jgi:hypothetical protein
MRISAPASALAVDGIAGVQTQIALASAVAGSDSPLLSANISHGG